jgi:hypothetical protein
MTVRVTSKAISLLLGTVALTSLAACGDERLPDAGLSAPSAGAGGNAPGGAGGFNGSSGASAGSGSQAVTPSAGGSSGAASGGGFGGVAGMAPGNAGGGAAAGGNSGAAGGAGQGGSANPAKIAADIDGFRLEAPCKDADHFGLDHTDNCDTTPEVDRQSYQRHLGGDPNVVYDVRVRARGLSEPNIYVNGKLTPPRYYVGGHSSTPDYSAYSITVVDPAQVYFFNYNASIGHFVFVVDVDVVIPMRGGTLVTFDVNGPGAAPNGHGVSNRERVVVPEVAPAPLPFNGQFMQFDVISVAEHE